jgi:hypothetical protein
VPTLLPVYHGRNHESRPPVKFCTTLRFCFILIASQLLGGCVSSGNGNTSSSPNPAALTGNWLIAGNLQSKQYPFLSASLIVSGNQIVAHGETVFSCSNLPGTSEGGPFHMSGTVNSDGTFNLGGFSFDIQTNSPSIQLVIDGSAPTGSPNTWNGTYSFTDQAGYTGCIVNQTSTFNATAVTPIHAAYAGPLTSGTFGSVVVNATIAQGTGVASPGVPGTDGAFLPLTGTITVTGLPCFTHGTSSSTAGGSVIEGDYVQLIFTMDDGSSVLLTGSLSEPDESLIYPAFLVVTTGNCSSPVNYYGTLTRQ